MPTGVEETIGILVGFIGWLTSLPDWIKYFIFVAGLSLTTFIATITNVGVISTILNIVINSIFGINIQVTEWQLLVIAVILPFVFYLTRMAMHPR